MSEALDSRPTTSFWVIGSAALIWNLIGLALYYSHVTMSPEALAGFTEAQQEFFNTTPSWATSAYAIAVNAGILGSLLLLLRKAWAVPVYILSLIGVVAQNFEAFVLSDAIGVWGTAGIYLPLIVIVIAAALVGYSHAAKRKGWIA